MGAFRRDGDAAGTVLFLALVAPPAFARRRRCDRGAAFARRCRLLVWGALLLPSAPARHGWCGSPPTSPAPRWSVCLHGGALTVLSETRFGLVAMMRLALALLLGGLMFWPANFGCCKWSQVPR